MGGPFGHVGGGVALLGHLLGPKWSQKRQDERLKSDLGPKYRWPEVVRGCQWVDFGKMFNICCLLSGILICFFFKKGLVHAVWHLDLDS